MSVPLREAINWKGLALGLAAHLEATELHMQVRTDKIGAAHAHEGRDLREAGQKLIALAKIAIESDGASVVDSK